MNDQNPMKPEDAARIQSAEAQKHGGAVPEGSFAARAQAAAWRNSRDPDDYPDTSEWMPDFD